MSHGCDIPPSRSITVILALFPDVRDRVSERAAMTNGDGVLATDHTDSTDG